MTILERFDKYKPIGKEIIDACTNGNIINILYDRTLKIAELIVEFPKLYNKSDVLYKIEKNISTIYGINKLTIKPKYAKELFTENYISEILCEAKRNGILSNHILTNEYKLDNNNLTIYLNFGEGGYILANTNKDAEKLSDIIYSEFEIKLNVDFEYNTDYDDHDFEELTKSKLDSLYSSSTSKSKEVNTYCSDYNEISINDNILKVGYSSFDISNTELIYGNEFNIEPMSLNKLLNTCSDVCCIGNVLNPVFETNKQKKFICTFVLTDFAGAIKCCIITDDSNNISFVEEGLSIAVFGNYQYDNDCLVLFVKSAIKVTRILREDTYNGEKRVELHLHTKMSQMDSILSATEAVSTASRWGHKAIAITDHGVVQGYPEAMRASKSNNIKILYGMEGYLVNDELKILYGETNCSFEDEIVVFDIETTGLHSYGSDIIEIGAVKCKSGNVIETFNTFVKPSTEINEETTKLTSITNEDVANAPSQYEAVKSFVEFVGNDVLVAHNANFDMSFIQRICKENSIKFDNSYIDTLSLARFALPDLTSYKLDTLTNYFKLGDFHHHRGISDAEITVKLFYSLQSIVEKEGIVKFEDLNKAIDGKVDPLKIKPNHISILVKNNIGLKNLYKLVSFGYLKYYHRVPRIPKSILSDYSEGLIFGTACSAGELYNAILEGKDWNILCEIASFYDYLEIMPVSNNSYLNLSVEELQNINKKIVKIGEETGKLVVATGDVHYLEKTDKISRAIMQSKQGYTDFDIDSELYFRTTDEMIEEFSYLGEEKAYEVVVKNTNLIADMIESGIKPYPDGTFTPKMEGAEEDLHRICFETARSIYGENLPEIVETRLNKELNSIIKNGFAVLYIIARKLVKYSESQGYLVGSRGSVGSSVVAFFGGISEVNPLPAHYVCSKCKYSDFSVSKDYGSGYDLPDKKCPICGTNLSKDGHDIPFETFLGFYGDKSPDIDLNFSGLVQGRVHKYTEDLFGAENVFHAGTIVGIAEKTAYSFVRDYMIDNKINLNDAMIYTLAQKITDVKRTTGQHPGGIVVVPKEYEVYDFCPVQIPPGKGSEDVITTHFTFNDMHDLLLKLDELGHDVPTKLKYLELYSNMKISDVPMSDPNVYKLFTSTEPLGVKPEDIWVDIGTLGIPESGTNFVMKVMIDSKPKNFSDLLQISGATHGTDVWNGNAEELIKKGICDLSTIVGTRDSIMLTLIRYGLDNKLAFDIMEMVRKNKNGKPLKPEHVEAMKSHNVPDWYIESLSKIKYMFPKAHAAAYVTSAIRLAWFKVYKPLEFYCAYYSADSDGFDAELALKGSKAIRNKLDEIDRDSKGRKKTANEKNTIVAMQICNELLQRKIKILPIDLYKSDDRLFLPENGGMRLPFSSLSGIGPSVATSIIEARKNGPFLSVEDLRERTTLGKSGVDLLKSQNILKNMPETNQISFNMYMDENTSDDNDQVSNLYTNNYNYNEEIEENSVENSELNDDDSSSVQISFFD